MKTGFRFLLLLMLTAPFGTAAAQTVDETMAAALDHWRAASWYTRVGDLNLAALETEGFTDRWRDLKDGRPAQHANDPRWSEVVSDVGKRAEVVAAAVEKSDGAEAARALAGIGDVLADSRQRAGTNVYPAAMRRYRDAINRLIAFMPQTERFGMGPIERSLHDQVRAVAVEASSAAAALAPLVPAALSGDAKYQSLLRQNIDGARSLAAAMERAQPPALGLEAYGLIGVARANYHLIFLSYGY